MRLIENPVTHSGNLSYLLKTKIKTKTDNPSDFFFNSLQYPAEVLDGAWCNGNLKHGGRGCCKERHSQVLKSIGEGIHIRVDIQLTGLGHFASKGPSQDSLPLGLLISGFHPPSWLFFPPPFLLAFLYSPVHSPAFVLLSFFPCRFPAGT